MHIIVKTSSVKSTVDNRKKSLLMAYLQTAGQTILLVYIALDRITLRLFVEDHFSTHAPSRRGKSRKGRK